MSRITTLLLLLLFILPVHANTNVALDSKDVPNDLKNWIPWVLHGHEQWRCPYIHNQSKQTICAWSTKLELNLQSSKGKFSQHWQVHAPSWLRLPGDARHWPQNVKINGRRISVTQDGSGYPVIFINKGKIEIRGEFSWSGLPETLQLPADSGIVSLRLKGRNIDYPIIDAQQRLWLTKIDAAESEDQSNDLNISVFRKVIDDIPLKIHTRIQLKVTGKQREVQLGPIIVHYFTPLSLHSQLPAQLDNDGKLRVQVRPGVWHIDIVTRSLAEVESLQMARIAAPWPQQELWVFEAQNHLRLVEIQNQSIDARQTNIPDEWKHLPAYLMQAGDWLKMTTIRRGNPQPEPDQLQLKRLLWLDFGGKGYTFKDHISGTITNGWRLETQYLFKLGRVTINNEPQFITRLNDKDKKSGVEIRRGRIAMLADGRIDSAQRSLPVSGWDKEFNQIHTQLQLPPGWSVFYASGTDNQPATFIQRWSLLDLFLVLVISVAMARLWSWHWGIIAFITMSVIWHQPGAPHYAWINLLIAIAFVRVLPENRFAAFMRFYKNISFVFLLLLLIPFVIQQARSGLHPQLDNDYRYSQAAFLATTQYAPNSQGDGIRFYDEGNLEGTDLPQAAAEPAPSVTADVGDFALAEKPRLPGKKLRKQIMLQSVQLSQAQNYNLIDPNANIQTGYGLPNWSWRSIHLRWNGPVLKGQHFNVIMIPPWLNSAIKFISIALIISLLLLFIGYSFKRLSALVSPGANIMAWLFAGSFILAGGLSSTPGYAGEIPDEQTLNTLRDKLLTPPNCLPRCAHVERMHIVANRNSMQLNMQIHTQADVAVPLPGRFDSWNPQRVLVDGKPASALRRDQQHNLWINLQKGVYRISLHGPMPKLANFTIELPLQAKYTSHKISAWRIDGIHEDGRIDRQLQFSRIASASGKDQYEQSHLPAFVYVERTLEIGIDWGITTRVTRISPSGSAIVLNIPTLPGETVTSDVNMKNDQVVVNMSPQQQFFSWHSRLQKTDKLSLRTDSEPEWFEIWRADISPIWHARISGIAPISHVDASRQWLPEWHPWPNESIHFEFLRPQGIDGKTLTIDKSHLYITPSQRAAAYHLQLELRSSQGGKHQFSLPADAELQSVTIDNRSITARLDNGQLSLPVIPGKQTIAIKWRQQDAQSIFYKAPAIKLGSDSTNSHTQIQFKVDRWILFVGGPRLGPAVLIWGMLIILLLIAIGLGRYKAIPLNSVHWFLLAIGLSQVSLWASAIFLGTFFTLAWRMQHGAQLRRWLFNLMQIGIALLVFIAAIILISAIHQGLLGYPDMQIAGNNSYAGQLNWYQDRVRDTLPQPWIISVPLIWYRLLMLAWALWLALAVIRWAAWIWECFSCKGMWKARPKPAEPREALPEPAKDQ